MQVFLYVGKMRDRYIILVLLFLFSSSLYAEQLKLAVASNFKQTLKQLAADFEPRTGHELIISSASSGKLYSQIINGAPYDVFFSADEKFADQLVVEGLAVQESRYIYALGKLVLVSNTELKAGCEEILRSSKLRRLAIANPKTAPYGQAAKQVLEKLDLWQDLMPRLARGENVSQAFQFVATKNADAGLVARAMLETSLSRSHGRLEFACAWDVPEDMYLKIRQKLVVLKRSRPVEAAVDEFIDYMQSDAARAIIRSSGYGSLY